MTVNECMKWVPFKKPTRTELIKKKFGTVKHYAEIKGWSVFTLRQVLCGLNKGRGDKGSAMIVQMKKDRVWGG